MIGPEPRNVKQIVHTGPHNSILRTHRRLFIGPLRVLFSCPGGILPEGKTIRITVISRSDVKQIHGKAEFFKGPFLRESVPDRITGCMALILSENFLRELAYYSDPGAVLQVGKSTKKARKIKTFS